MSGTILASLTPDGNYESAYVSDHALHVKVIEAPAVTVTVAAPTGPVYLPTLSRATSVGAYLVGGNQVNVTTAADNANTGSQYLLNPLDSGKNIAVKRAHISGGAGALSVALLTTPNFQLQRFLFTGTPTAAGQTIIKQDSTMPESVANLRNAKTGINVTVGTTFYNYQLAQVISAVGQYAPPIAFLDLNVDSQIVLRPGEGIMVRQASGGSVGDTRFLQVDWAWEEFI